MCGALFKKFYGDDANAKVERVRNTLYNLFDEYKSQCNVNESSPMETQFEDLGDEDDFARTKRQKIDYVLIKSEIDQYLESRTLPENNEFNILAWWKIDESYPTLRKIAIDILAIPVSSIALESAFSTGGRVVSAHRSRLHSQTVEALMCLQNWMVDDVKGNFILICTFSPYFTN